MLIKILLVFIASLISLLASLTIIYADSGYGNRIAEQAVNLANRLVKSDNTYYNIHTYYKFAEPDKLPQTVKDFFRKPTNTNPNVWYAGEGEWDAWKYPDNYVECVAFVQMVYHSTDPKFTRLYGNGESFADGQPGFNLYKNLVDSEHPQSGDIAAWDSSIKYSVGHVGIITKVNKGFQKYYVDIANSNTENKFVQYTYTEVEKTINNQATKVVQFKTGGPDAWLRRQPELIGESLQVTKPSELNEKYVLHITQTEVSYEGDSKKPKVKIFFTAQDEERKTVYGLTRQNFQLTDRKNLVTKFEVKEPEKQTHPSKANVLVLDISGSMQGVPVDEAKNATIEFIKGIPDEDEVEIIGFDTQIYQASGGFQTDKQRLIKSLDHIAPDGGTAVYNGIYQALEDVRDHGIERKHVILLSDGGDNQSTKSREKVKRLADELKVPIFTVEFHSSDSNPEHTQLLKDLANDTNGRYFQANDLKAIEKIYTTIGVATADEYMIEFTSELDKEFGKEDDTDSKSRRLILLRALVKNLSPWDSYIYEAP